MPMARSNAYILDIAPPVCAREMDAPSPGAPTIIPVATTTINEIFDEILTPVPMYGIVLGNVTRQRVSSFRSAKTLAVSRATGSIS